MTCEDIRATRQLLGQREVSVTEHVQAVLSRIQQADPELGAFLAAAGDPALQAAEQADARVRALGPAAWRNQPLLGITVAVKDLIQTSDLPTTRGSRLPNRRAGQDPPAVARLRAAGAIVVGKTTTSEYGWSASTVGRLAAPTRNPRDRERSAGGSSGGSAAAVAAGLCTAALGTDGAGSIRIPAAFCGVVGYKPSYGRVPYVPAGADRLSHLGPLTRTVADARELAAVLAGPHRLDPDSGPGKVRAALERGRLRIGWIEFPGTSAEVRQVSEQVWPVLTGQGHQLECLPPPFVDPYPALVDILAATEAAGAAPGDEPAGDPDRLVVAAYGRTVTGTAVVRAEQARLALRTTLQELMERYDVLAMATVPIEPFEVAAIAPAWAAHPADLLWLAWAPACYPFNLTGQPALSLPVGSTRSGLPVGLQLVGPAGGDGLVLATAHRIEAELGAFPVAPVRLPERML